MFSWPLAQIGRGFERLEISLVLYSEDDDRRGCVDVGVREDSAKDGMHPLELDAGAASLFLGGVSDYYKMGRRHFEPGKGLRTCGRDKGGEQKQRPQDSSKHYGSPVGDLSAESALQTRVLKRKEHSTALPVTFPWQQI